MVSNTLRVASALLTANGEGYRVGLRHGVLLALGALVTVVLIEADQRRRQATQTQATQQPQDATAVPWTVDYWAQTLGAMN